MTGELVELRIPGEWSDGWLYKDQLFLWGADGNLIHSSTQRLIARVRRDYGEDVALAVHIALFRNDWKGGIQTAAFKRSPAMNEAMLGINRAVSTLAALEVSSDLFDSVDIEYVPGFILSVSIYGNHAFIGTSEGLFESNLNPDYLNRNLELIQRLDMPVHALDTNYGAIAASAFEEGLWFDRIDFGESGSWLSGGPLDNVAEYSRGVAMASRDLLNFTDAPVPDLYLATATHELQSDRARFPSWQIFGYERASTQLSVLSARSFEVSGEVARTGGLRLLANSKQRLLFEVDGTLRLLQLRTLNGVRLDDAGALDVRFADITRGASIVSSHALADGFVIETAARVTFVNPNGTIDLSNEPAINVRTFPDSKHFNDTGLLTTDDAVRLVGFADFPSA